jgi:hypothetical protein
LFDRWRARRAFRGLLAAVAVLWPCRISGLFDGVPLDGRAEAMLVGAVFPALWWFHPRFLDTRTARACVIALLGWKALTAATLVQDGWCVSMVPSRPYAADATGAPHSWDVRADWHAADPACSAVMTRAYHQLSEFPAWFFNLPPANNEWPVPLDRPPGATVGMTVNGFLHTRGGVLQIVTGPDVAAALRVDGVDAPRGDAAGGGVTLMPGTHRITIDATLTGDRWQFVPLWNGGDLWTSAVATLEKPSRLDLAIRPVGTWIVAALVGVLALA